LLRIEDAGDICLRRPRPTQDCRADDDDDLSYLKKRFSTAVILNYSQEHAGNECFVLKLI
jgi:hypothetical protein